jgi:glycopeptide antibiotics resistance protein
LTKKKTKQRKDFKKVIEVTWKENGLWRYTWVYVLVLYLGSWCDFICLISNSVQAVIPTTGLMYGCSKSLYIQTRENLPAA